MPSPFPPPPPSSRSSSRTSTRTTATTTALPSYNALLGANLAFLKTSPLPPNHRRPSAIDASQPSSSHHDENHLPRRGRSTAPQNHKSGSEVVNKNEPRGLDPSGAPHLALPHDRRFQPATSPSQQAAVLAAARARSSSAVPDSSPATGDSIAYTIDDRSNTSLPVPETLSRNIASRAAQVSGHGPNHATPDQPTDTTSIPPTSSLVHMFEHASRGGPEDRQIQGGKLKEQNSNPQSGSLESSNGDQTTTSLVDLFEKRDKEAQHPGEKPEPIVIKPTKPLALQSPKPVRSGITSVFHLELPENNKNYRSEQQKLARRQGESMSEEQDNDRVLSDDSFASASEDLEASSPTWSPKSAKTRSSTGQPTLESKFTDDTAKVSPAPLRQQTKPLSIKPIQPRRASESVPGEESMPTAPHHVPSASSPRSFNSIQAQFHQTYPRKMTPLTTGDDLANALVASSLASSRAASPSRLDLPPLSSHKKRSQHHSIFSFSRTPSPAKGGMPHTLRKTESSSESEDEHHPYGKHRKKRLVRKHPNKHHEGDRKRWRDAVTDRERKRYEGVWAANKGLHYSFTLEEQDLFRHEPTRQRTLQTQAMVKEQVSNIVARDIWHRSRLSETILEVVWELVDNNGVGRLQKDEFVVGMWLIDQRLKGRKLPVKVSETVWQSVRGIQGIKLRR